MWWGLKSRCLSLWCQNGRSRIARAGWRSKFLQTDRRSKVQEFLRQSTRNVFRAIIGLTSAKNKRNKWIETNRRNQLSSSQKTGLKCSRRVRCSTLACKLPKLTSLSRSANHPEKSTRESAVYYQADKSFAIRPWAFHHPQSLNAAPALSQEVVVTNDHTPKKLQSHSLAHLSLEPS